MAEAAANALGCPTDSILVCSTGVIGVPLPIEQVREAIREAASNLNGSTIEAARAIMTTDTVEKMAGAACEQFRVAGFAKGSGMVHPNMGTMLAFLVTDAAIAPHDLQTCLERVTERTFNCVTVDGDTSTNDTVILQATGRGAFLKDDGLERFEALLGETCQTLAKAIARDGEGASRLLEVRVKGCACDSEARDAARAVARSPLVKTAVYGCDPNWGRIVAALGAEGVPGLDDVSVDVAGMSLVSGGAPLPFDEKLASQAMRVQEVAIEIALPGPGAGVAWGCDLTGEYVRINAEYRS
jgi:glutamate N-acetyltransferase/amino-acid N-acetyltransferase